MLRYSVQQINIPVNEVTSITMDPGTSPDLLDRLEALLRQESTIYRKVHSLPESKLPQKDNCSPNGQFSGWDFRALNSEASPSSGVNQRWRERICEWSYRVVDHFGCDRETVSVSLSYLDRFLSKKQVNQKVFQVAAMTTLYVAIKLYEPRTLTMESLIGLSGEHMNIKADHIVTMEMAILRQLQWNMHPPTPQTFSRHFIALLPNDMPDKLKEDILDHSLYLSELSVYGQFFCTSKPSTIALASIMLAFDFLLQECQGADFAPCKLMKHSFVSKVEEVLPHSDVSSNREIKSCFLFLQEIYASVACSTKRSNQHNNRTTAERDVGTVSPTCVTSVVN